MPAFSSEVDAGELELVNEKKLQAAVHFIRQRVKVRPRVALILGSGLGDFANQLAICASIRSTDIPYYPRSTVQGHAGKLIFGHLLEGKRKSAPILVFKGRVHFYEIASLSPVLFPVYLASSLGVKTLIVTNAAGGINRSYRAGQLMLIRDILSLTFLKLVFKHVLTEKASKELDWPLSLDTSVFDRRLQDTMRNSARRKGIELQEGTYCWLKGPTYETAAEVAMLRHLGADAVGMSTVPEILAAKQLGMKVAGISLISNLATGMTGEKLSHTEVTRTAKMVKRGFTSLMKEILLRI
ncbi:MAG TPA: purine-nucleoside phosphorylase [Bacteroidota bacterium]